MEKEKREKIADAVYEAYVEMGKRKNSEVATIRIFEDGSMRHETSGTSYEKDLRYVSVSPWECECTEEDDIRAELDAVDIWEKIYSDVDEAFQEKKYIHIITGAEDTKEGWILSYLPEELEARRLTAEEAFEEDEGTTLFEAQA